MSAPTIDRTALESEWRRRTRERAADVYRSMLFMPGHKREWMLKAGRFGADAFIYDLEDAVPIESKPEGREAVAGVLGELKDEHAAQFVRTNAWRTGELVKDLDAIVTDGLAGIVLPKVEGPEDVAALDLVLSELELDRGLEVGRIEIVPLPETARGMYLMHDVCLASRRVRRASFTLVATPGGDYPRTMNMQLSPDGRETMAVGQYTGMAARAAGVTHVLGGMTTELENFGLVREIAEWSKRLGATGATAIHPSHVAIINEVYSPSPAEIEEARATVQAMAAAVEQGHAATRSGGRMIDYAHVRTALDLLDTARRFGLEVGDVPHLDVID